MTNYTPPRVPYGEQHPMAKLTNIAVRTIRSLYRAGEAQRALARAFDVDRTTVRAVVRGWTWRHVA